MAATALLGVGYFFNSHLVNINSQTNFTLANASYNLLSF